MLQHWVGRVNEVTKLLVGICCRCGSGLAFEREPEREGGGTGCADDSACQPCI